MLPRRRFLQDQLDLRVKPHVDAIFEAVLGEAATLAMDPFGNYLIQKLLQYGSSEQRDVLVESTQSQVRTNFTSLWHSNLSPQLLKSVSSRL